MQLRHFLLISLFCCATLALPAQGILQRQADQAMQDLDYMTAIEDFAKHKLELATGR